MSILIPVGVDLAKNIFQVYHTNQDTGEVVNRSVRRGNFLAYFANMSPCLIGMEAGSGAHHWARQLTEMGHEVKMMPGAMVKAFNIGNKTDAADARAICMAVQQPIKRVAIKTVAQQSMLTLHRIREQKVKIRTMQINSLRGLLAEFGEVMGVSRKKLNEGVPEALVRLSEILDAVVIENFRDIFKRIHELDVGINKIEQQLKDMAKEDTSVQAILEIPGIGLLSATACVATMGNPKAFRSGREFASWLGLVPKQRGSGGKMQMGGISKRGDTYLRTMLIHGARSVLVNAKNQGAWVEDIKKRKPFNVAVVALANKMARTIWAMLAHGRPYQRGHKSTPPVVSAWH